MWLMERGWIAPLICWCSVQQRFLGALPPYIKDCSGGLSAPLFWRRGCWAPFCFPAISPCGHLLTIGYLRWLRRLVALFSLALGWSLRRPRPLSLVAD